MLTMSLPRRIHAMVFFKKKENSSQKQPDPSLPGKILRVSEFLKETNIRFLAAGTPEDAVIAELISTLNVPDPALAKSNILQREKAGSTVIAPGIAIPHARVTGLSGIQAALGILK